MANRLPDFLVIGAMKAGTTTLYRDLYEQPSIFLPEEKEPNNLTMDEVLTPAGTKAYAQLFAGCKPGQLAGEMSTAYTKAPRFQGSAERARQLLGPDLKLIYLVRDPVQRAVSQHHHEFEQGKASRALNDDIINLPRFADYSRYHMQIAPWIEAFGPEALKIVRFEDYVADRPAVCREIMGFIGAPWTDVQLETEKKFNAGGAKPVVRNPLLKAVRDSRFYKTVVKPMMPWKMREAVRQKILPKAAEERPEDLLPETRALFLHMIADDLTAFERLAGAAAPLWRAA
jgi:hypothetical protein